MLKKLLTIIPSLVLMCTFAVGALQVTSAGACSTPKECATQGATSASGSTTPKSAASILKNIVNILLYITGAVAVIMVVLGGFKYVTSNGDSAQLKSAKDTILYSVVGIILAIAGYAIVNFVIKNF